MPSLQKIMLRAVYLVSIETPQTATSNWPRSESLCALVYGCATFCAARGSLCAASLINGVAFKGELYHEHQICFGCALSAFPSGPDGRCCCSAAITYVA